MAAPKGGHFALWVDILTRRLRLSRMATGHGGAAEREDPSRATIPSRGQGQGRTADLDEGAVTATSIEKGVCVAGAVLSAVGEAV